MDLMKSATLHHTCFVVHDLEKTARKLADSLSIRPWAIWNLEPADSRVHGREVPFTFSVALAQVGGASYELISPGTGRSVYVEQLETRGEGFHHTCLVFDRVEAMREAKAGMEQRGRIVLQSGSFGELGEFCYVEIAEIGSALELLYLDFDKLPPPDKTIE